MLRALRFVALLGSAALLLNACGSSNSTTPPKSTLDFWNVGVKVLNETPYCARITVYYSSGFVDTWHEMDGATTRPRYVNAGDSYNFAYQLFPKIPFTGFQIKVLAEVKEQGCGGGTFPNPPYNTATGLSPAGGVDADVCVHVFMDHGKPSVNTPTVYRPDSGGCP